MKTYKKILLLVLFLLVAIFFGINTGSTNFSLLDLFSSPAILHLRMSRVALSLLAGAGLGVCGVVLQAILRNPLAEPYLLGVSSGAGFGAVIALILGISSVYLPVAAFVGAFFSVSLVYVLASDKRRVESLILSGVIVAITFSGITVFLASTSQKALHGMMWWLLGSLQVYDLKLLVIVGIIVTIGVFVIFLFGQDLNAISIGEEDAVHLGIEIDKVKKILFVITAFVTGAIVSVCGVIGFVGLIVPHVLRLAIGPNHRTLLVATCLGSGSFLIFCDTLSRTLFSPIEIPIGVVTSVIGAPIFIILLKKKGL